MREYEMPTPCQHCGEIFDLNDGSPSYKWYPDTLICPECAEKEEQEIERDQEIEEINNDISNALYSLDQEENWKWINKENVELITRIYQKINV